MRIRDDCRRHPISSHLYATLSYIKHNFFCLLVAVFFSMPFCFSYNIKNTQSHLRCTHSAAHWSQFQVLLSCFAAFTIPRVPIISPPTIPIIGQQILLRMRDNGSNWPPNDIEQWTFGDDVSSFFFWLTRRCFFLLRFSGWQENENRMSDNFTEN